MKANMIKIHRSLSSKNSSDIRQKGFFYCRSPYKSASYKKKILQGLILLPNKSWSHER